ncbi:putative oxidoreductase TDA3 [Cyberlindnera fabianii]|uniref:Putative oxidoreductase TDA3 n=1 Tax=Cyberlindnera fabianii TaxID=36022 RepID=A0A1V2LBF3_CYBFA|nr:putative oxidoreductase TDA3 [Cyberlindnera fabianii]
MSETYLTFNSTPSGKADGKTHIIIVGAGIIGVCTAYYLTRHPDFSPETHHITIIESKRVAGGASGKAGGLLALWAFPQPIVPLSFKLHQELSDEYNGEEEWGYRRLTTVSLEGNIQHILHEDEDDEASNSTTNSVTSMENVGAGCKTSTPLTSLESLKPQEMDRQGSDGQSLGKRTVTKNSIKHEDLTSTPHLPGDLNWIRSEIIEEWSELGGRDSTAQVHPYKFTNFILKKAIETGAVELILGKVDEILFSDETGAATGLSYTPTKFIGKGDDHIEILGDQIVLSMGPWTSRILPDCPISGLRAHSITIAPDKGTVSPYAIFTELKIGRNKYVSPEIYARKDEVYVCGEGDTLVDLPETTDDVEVIKEKCDQLFHYVSKLSPNLSKGHILKRQACYLPVLDVPSSSGPLIGETNVENLYLASGHSCWGINNAPGTGKLMAELLLEGVTHSADISGLDPSLYFDASVLVDE